MATCPSGKTRHTTREIALIHKKQLLCKGEKGKLSVYRCVSCGFWHVGHKGVGLSREQHRTRQRENFGEIAGIGPVPSLGDQSSVIGDRGVSL